MRFDDTLTTIMGQPASDGRSLAAVWAQIIDILAQDRGTLDAALKAEALHRARAVRSQIEERIRRTVALTIAPHCRSPELVHLFAEDQASIAAPVLMRALLDEDQWCVLIPKLPTPARALLRERRDLTAAVGRLLQSYGASDYALTSAVQGAVDAPLGAEPSPISELIKRIDAYRDRRIGAVALESDTTEAPREPATSSRRFRFATGPEGMILAVEGVPAGPIIGIDLSRMAQAGSSGVDGTAAGAFRSRSSFSEAHLTVPGTGPVSGKWIISCLPRFAEETGRFLGYRGTARRPARLTAAADAASEAPGLPDGLRQFMHEMRTPLNAVRGFAEIIAEQLYGPVSQSYQLRAQAIVRDAERLTTLFDDLHLFAHNDLTEPSGGQRVDIRECLAPILAEAQRIGQQRRIVLSFVAAENPPPIRADSKVLASLLTRFIHTMISAAAPLEDIRARLTCRGADVLFVMSRPKSLARLDDAHLFDPSSDPIIDVEAGPLLGFGFAMRLVRSLAFALEARLEISRQTMTLRLPACAMQADSSVV